MAKPILMVTLLHLKKLIKNKFSAKKNMIDQLSELEENRLLLLSQTEHLTVGQYNLIPAGFNNNIIWNLGHLLFIGDCVLYYHLQELRPEYILLQAKYGKGSKPDGLTSLSEILHIRQLLTETISIYKTAIQYQSGPLETATENVVQAISPRAQQFLFFHEEMHYSKIAKLLQIVSS